MTHFSTLLDSLLSDLKFEHMGLTAARTPNTLTFLDSDRFLPEVIANPNLIGVITSQSHADTLSLNRPSLAVIVSDEPRAFFYSLYNERARRNEACLPQTSIHESAQIHDRAYVDPCGVVIEAGVVVEPMVTILPGVRIGPNTIVRAGSCLGIAGFEHKRTRDGLLSVVHDGFVKIGKDVEIGANNTIARGLMGEDTEIGDFTKTDCLVHIAHCAKLGKRCLVPASAMIAGSAVIGDDVWIGPNASVSSQVRLGSGAFVTIGAVVVRDVAENERVTGNFAVSHATFVSQAKAVAGLAR